MKKRCWTKRWDSNIDPREITESGEINLLIAIIRQAWDDVFNNYLSNDKDNKEQSRQLFEDTNGRWHRSLNIMSEAIGLDANKIREGYWEYKTAIMKKRTKIDSSSAFYFLIRNLLDNENSGIRFRSCRIKRRIYAKYHTAQ